MIAISLIGAKKSGKTTLGLRLAATLTAMGKNVSVAKFSSHHLETGANDTARYAEVASAVAGIGPAQSLLHLPPKSLADLLPLLAADVLIIEGGKSLAVGPRILCLEGDLADGTDWLSPDLAVATWGGPGVEGIPAYDDVDALARLVLERGFLLAGLDCGACGREDCRAMVRDIVAGNGAPEDCEALNSSVRVSINGADLGMKPFVEDMFGAAVRAMLAQLKGYAPGKAVIEIDV